MGARYIEKGLMQTMKIAILATTHAAFPEALSWHVSFCCAQGRGSVVRPPLSPSPSFWMPPGSHENGPESGGLFRWINASIQL